MSDAIGIWLVRVQGEPVGRRLQARLGGELFRPWLDANVPQPVQFATAYPRFRQWIVVGASGIAVRFVNGLIGDKHSDPALVVLDEAARHAISLLAGHEGGANRLAYHVGNAVGAVPVVTTATEALKPLVLGVGCRKGVAAERIEAVVRKALAARSLDQVREVATIDLKADEPGLLAFCRQHDLPLRVFARETVAARVWVSQPSAWVQQNLGVDGVCEPCALLASPRSRLLVSKTTYDGVAVAVSQDLEEVSIE